ncbi:ABC transporter ATP-binding protein [Corynebacterium diphtheriae]|uniref:ABC transporter ATP-binding protein n=1 Tax=Corynebacterium diphtheriae TaxID=1717 RepID=UPI0018CAE8A5|nr:ATP-binding cassette domain-containing protein [Corynebacterium diphtheriae]MBG9345473.1 ATP-binding cassette domain-containing protein [Corynebacterium diphtheriae bv. gravis]MBG9352715.1 ATP-binding cassette domain-containing protein [Corynebacterium diphtheriae bv. gravis]
MIEFESVSKRYGKRGEKAVADFSLFIPKGKTTVLVGSSGSGKTTLLRMINRMVEPTEGRVIVRGKDVAETDPVQLRRSIGYVIQSAGLLPHRTVIQNIALVPTLNKEPKAEIERRAKQALADVNLEPSLANRYPGELSGGQQQRVGVARALASDPDILLMDEPFGAVDPIVRRSLQKQLIDLQSRLHKTVVMVTHDIDEAFCVGDHIVVLEKGGKIAQQGSPAHVFAHPANDFVASFLGSDQENRSLYTELIDGHTVVVDTFGRPLGTLGDGATCG